MTLLHINVAKSSGLVSHRLCEGEHMQPPKVPDNEAECSGLVNVVATLEGLQYLK